MEKNIRTLIRRIVRCNQCDWLVIFIDSTHTDRDTMISKSKQNVQIRYFDKLEQNTNYKCSVVLNMIRHHRLARLILIPCVLHFSLIFIKHENNINCSNKKQKWTTFEITSFFYQLHNINVDSSWMSLNSMQNWIILIHLPSFQFYYFKSRFDDMFSRFAGVLGIHIIIEPTPQSFNECRD